MTFRTRYRLTCWAIMLGTLALAMLLLTGCHAVHGIGQDLQWLTAPYVE